MTGDLQVTYAICRRKPVAVLGKDEAQAPVEGEVIYMDDDGTICRRWNWREKLRALYSLKTRRTASLHSKR
jgi:DNA/RNA-binding domain of Phe-tRNA-synthetase-like protein